MAEIQRLRLELRDTTVQLKDNEKAELDRLAARLARMRDPATEADSEAVPAPSKEEPSSTNPFTNTGNPFTRTALPGAYPADTSIFGTAVPSEIPFVTSNLATVRSTKMMKTMRKLIPQFKGLRDATIVETFINRL